MRARFFFFAASVTLGGAAFGVQACSSTNETTPSSVADSGSDVVEADTGAPAPDAGEQDSATCDMSADFSTSIPDASIADGATTTGVCLACAHAKCEDEVKACNQACTCQELASIGLGCFLENAGKSNQELYQKCGGPFLGVDDETRDQALAVLGCLNDKCPTECATSTFAPQDAGNDADAN